MRGGNPKPYVPPRKERCLNGHDLTVEGAVLVVRRKNTRTNGKTYYEERQCRQCRQDRDKAWRQREKP